MEKETEMVSKVLGPDEETKTEKPKSRKFMVVMIIILLAAAGAGVYWWYLLQTTISTENAKVVTDISDISFRVGGRMEQISVADGDKVAKGQELAALDREQYRIAMEQAQAALDLAKANYARLPYDLQSKNMAVAKARDQVAIAGTAVSTAQIAVNDTQRVLSKNEELFKSGAISEESLNTSRSSYEKAVAALESARFSLQSAQISLRDNQQQEVAADKTSEPALLAGVKQAQAVYDAAAYNYNNSILKSPLEGTVVRTAVQVGETVTAGQTVLSLACPDNTWIIANIEEKKINRVHAGQGVEIRIDSYPGKVFKGSVASVGDVSQSTFALFSSESTSGSFTKVSQRVPVKISFDNQGLALKVGTSAQVKIYTGK
ncbi:MAG: HlyD family secretion protein [Syntrophomonadaceae bacterium]|nr:HlyD family secretion protein [Syntrophomonadaceae bacterium]